MVMIQKKVKIFISGDNEQLQANFSLVVTRDGIKYIHGEVSHRKEQGLCIRCN